MLKIDMRKILFSLFILLFFVINIEAQSSIDLTGSFQLTIPLRSFVQTDYISLGPSIRSDFFVFQRWQGVYGLGLSVESELNFDISTVIDGRNFINWSLYAGICWQIDIELNSFSFLIKPGFRIGFNISNDSVYDFYEGYIADCQLGVIFDQGISSTGFLLILTPAYKIIPLGNNNSFDIKISVGWRF